MPYIECIDCGESFQFSEHNHVKQPKPNRCPECREISKIEQSIEEASNSNRE